MIKQFKNKNNLIEFLIRTLDYSSDGECTTIYELKHNFMPIKKIDFVKVDLGNEKYDWYYYIYLNTGLLGLIHESKIKEYIYDNINSFYGVYEHSQFSYSCYLSKLDNTRYKYLKNRKELKMYE